jgi:hypothetical protein
MASRQADEGKDGHDDDDQADKIDDSAHDLIPDG